MALSRFFPVQGIHLGPDGTYASLNVSALNLPGQLGMVTEDNGKVYRIVQFDNGQGNVASVAGGVVHWKDRANFVVTSDQTDAQATINSVAGATLGVVTDQYYCAVQIGGLQTALVAASTAAGDVMVGGTTDNTFARTASGTAPVGVAYGVAYTAISSGSASVYWNLGNLL